MLVSLERKFAFIHIPKTAGTSVHQALADVAPDAVDRFEELPASKDPLKGYKHPFASDLRDYLGDQTWNSLFTFAFVRNPWARLVSWYNHSVQNATGPFSRLVQEKTRTFDDFLFLTEGLAARTLFNQVDHISDKDGRVLVDFVGRFEDLAADFTCICERLEISPGLPHIYESPHVDYRTYYTPSTRDLVAARFSRDVQAFGYQFDRCIPDHPVGGRGKILGTNTKGKEINHASANAG
jgi:hypothetical protein